MPCGSMRLGGGQTGGSGIPIAQIVQMLSQFTGRPVVDKSGLTALYDFSLNTVLYYFPDPNHPGRYTSNPRYFYNFATGQIITR